MTSKMSNTAKRSFINAQNMPYSAGRSCTWPTKIAYTARRSYPYTSKMSHTTRRSCINAQTKPYHDLHYSKAPSLEYFEVRSRAP